MGWLDSIGGSTENSIGAAAGTAAGACEHIDSRSRQCYMRVQGPQPSQRWLGVVGTICRSWGCCLAEAPAHLQGASGMLQLPHFLMRLKALLSQLR